MERVLGPLEKFLPTQLQAQPVALPGPEPSQEVQSAALGKRRVLLIEDDENTRTVLNMVLSKQFYDVTEAENGLVALEKVFKQAPEVILCDVMMPKMDGYEVISRLRSDPRTRRIPILMLTAADDEATELTCLEKGADDFVSKASDTKIILARVARLLERA